MCPPRPPKTCTVRRGPSDLSNEPSGGRAQPGLREPPAPKHISIDHCLPVPTAATLSHPASILTSSPSSLHAAATARFSNTEAHVVPAPLKTLPRLHSPEDKTCLLIHSGLSPAPARSAGSPPPCGHEGHRAAPRTRQAHPGAVPAPCLGIEAPEGPALAAETRHRPASVTLPRSHPPLGTSGPRPVPLSPP